MAEQCCMGASMQCSFGMAPATLVVLPLNRVLTGTPSANIMDYVPFLNITPFGMCSSLANPAVAAATAAAFGVLTPMPCTPMTATPWVPGAPTVMLANMPTLNSDSKLICTFGGVIEIQSAGQTSTTTP